MIIGDQQRELLAELKDMPSFVLLMEIMKQFEEDVLSEVTLCKQADDLVRVTRFYQCLRSIREFLESRPQAASDEIERIKKTYFIDSEVGVPIDVFRRRFNPDASPNEAQGTLY